MPLSEYEQRVLDQLEAQLVSEDPKLESRLAAVNAPRRGRIVLGVSGVVVGLAVLVLGLVIAQTWLSFVGFLVMFVGGYLAVTTSKPKVFASDGPKTKGTGKSGLSERFQKRFEERDGL